MEPPGSARDFDEPRETPDYDMLINDTDMTLRPVKASQTAAPQSRKRGISSDGASIPDDNF